MDSRVKNLADSINEAELASLLSTLYLAMDDASFSDAQKIKLTTLLYGSVVADGSIYSRALTPAGFWASFMTDVRRGVGQLATDGEVTGKTAGNLKLLKSEHQTLMQTQWLKDWFQSVQLPSINFADDLSDPHVIAFTVTLNKAMSIGEYVRISPALITNRRFDKIVGQHASYSNSTSGASASIIVTYTGSETVFSLVSGAISLRLSSDGRIIYVKSSVVSTALSSLTLNCTILTLA